VGSRKRDGLRPRRRSESDAMAVCRWSAIVTCYECGAVSETPIPWSVRSRAPRSLLFGGALFEAVHFIAGAITNGSFSAYRVPRISDVPPIEVVLLNRPDLALGRSRRDADDRRCSSDLPMPCST